MSIMKPFKVADLSAGVKLLVVHGQDEDGWAGSRQNRRGGAIRRTTSDILPWARMRLGNAIQLRSDVVRQSEIQVEGATSLIAYRGACPVF
jgi:hypothetical protein